MNISTYSEREILVESRFIEKSPKNLENFNLDEDILKLLRGKIVIFPKNQLFPADVPIMIGHVVCQ